MQEPILPMQDEKKNPISMSMKRKKNPKIPIPPPKKNNEHVYEKCGTQAWVLSNTFALEQ